MTGYDMTSQFPDAIEELSADRPWTETEHLLYFLRDQDASCPRCKASLRDLTHTQCPGCHSELTVSPGIVELDVRAWAITTSALCAGAGMGLLLLAFVTSCGWPSIHSGRDWFLVFSLMYFFLCIPLAAILIRKRRPFLLLSPLRQRCTAWMAVVLAILALISFLVGV